MRQGSLNPLLPCHIPTPPSLRRNKNLHATSQDGLEQGASLPIGLNRSSARKPLD